MRDPQRISEILDLLGKIWQKQPDIRFNQLVHNLQARFHEETGAGTYCEGRGNMGNAYDMFYVEDDAFITFLQQKLEEE